MVQLRVTSSTEAWSDKGPQSPSDYFFPTLNIIMRMFHGRCVEVKPSLVQQAWLLCEGRQLPMQEKNHETLPRREAHYLS